MNQHAPGQGVGADRLRVLGGVENGAVPACRGSLHDESVYAGLAALTRFGWTRHGGQRPVVINTTSGNTHPDLWDPEYWPKEIIECDDAVQPALTNPSPRSNKIMNIKQTGSSSGEKLSAVLSCLSLNLGYAHSLGGMGWCSIWIVPDGHRYSASRTAAHSVSGGFLSRSSTNPPCSSRFRKTAGATKPQLPAATHIAPCTVTLTSWFLSPVVVLNFQDG